MDKTLIYTTDKCIGCNKCIKSCPGIGVNQSVFEGDNSRIIVDPEKCIHCGTCLHRCDHKARRFSDDLDDVLAGLENNEKIVLLIAPSFFLSHSEEAPYILGFLSSLGFYAMYDVTYGANITTWACIKYTKQTKRTGLISSACPVIVDYIEKYKPSLISRLMPVMSPAGCLMTYLESKIYCEETDIKYAFFGPCIGKHEEYTSYPDGRKFDYSFTFKSLFSYIRDDKITPKQYGKKSCNELPTFGRGCFYPIPGAMGANIKNFLTEENFVKQIEGPERVFSYLDVFEKMMLGGDSLPLFVDILNCEGGCNEGVATLSSAEDAEILTANVFANLSSYTTPKADEPFAYDKSPEERWTVMDDFFTIKQDLDYRDFMRKFNEDASILYPPVTEEELDAIFVSMKKTTSNERNINCTSCGYKSCKQMATAIYHGYNSPENCVHYVKDALLNSKHQMEQVLASLNGGDEKAGLTMTDSDQIVEAILKAVNEVENKREELNNSIHARTNMFANLTHELRTPLNAIMSMTDMMDRKNLSEEQLNSLKSIQTAGNGLMDTIGEILDFSKMEAGKFSIIEDSYHLHELLREIATIMSFRCVEKKLQFIRKLDRTIPNELIGDSRRIRQICINTIGNAIKYTNLGSVTADVSWNHNKDDVHLIIGVSDTGIGIKDEDIPFLFDSYKRVDEKDNQHIIGTGLGLSITKNLVDSMGGTITVNSKYGVGTKFTIDLPQRVNDFITIGEVIDSLNNTTSTEADESAKSNADSIFYSPSCRVLVVDDIAVNLQIARAFLDQMQIYSDIALSGEEAVKMCFDRKYDFLFIDHLMPNMNGLETIAAIKASGGHNTDTPIIYLSAFDEGDLNEIAGNIAQGFIEKPIKKEQLRSVLRSLIAEENIINEPEGCIPSPEDIENAAKNGDTEGLLLLYASIERYCLHIGDDATTRFIKKYRIMLQQGNNELPINSVDAVIARCKTL